MSGHTPGSWSFEQASSDDYGSRKDVSHWVRSKPLHGVERLGGMVLASVVSDCISSSEANARLIASAPTLLSALELVKIRLNTCLCDELDMGEGTMTRLLDEVSEAIARAKGEQV